MPQSFFARQSQKPMRNFQTLDQLVFDHEAAILYISASEAGATQPRLALRREGEYVPISASYGPLEIALRLRYTDLKWTLEHLQPVPGLQVSRDTGTEHAFLALGLTPSGELIARPTLEVDATGRISFNLLLTANCRQAFFEWLGIAQLSG